MLRACVAGTLVLAVHARAAPARGLASNSVREFAGTARGEAQVRRDLRRFALVTSATGGPKATANKLGTQAGLSALTMRSTTASRIFSSETVSSGGTA